jgi:soluble lytic murein transglycosylase-like protein
LRLNILKHIVKRLAGTNSGPAIFSPYCGIIQRIFPNTRGVLRMSRIRCCLSFAVASAIAAPLLANPAIANENRPIQFDDVSVPSFSLSALQGASAATPAKTPSTTPAAEKAPSRAGADVAPAGIRARAAHHAASHGVPAALADAVIKVESRYNPRAANAGNYGLMQIRLQTARGIGYSGGAGGLLDAETNLRYGMAYLAMAYRAAGGDICGTVMRYQSGLAARGMNGANRAYCSKVRQYIAQG